MEFSERITGAAHGGDGVCRHEGQVCFVAGGLPGDLVRVNVVRQAKNVLWGEIAEVIEPSPDRIDAVCGHSAACGGCSWLHFAYPAQGDWKWRIVRDSFQRLARLEIEPEWLEDASLRTGYRTRAEFRGAPGAIGFYGRGTHDVADIESCPLLHARLNEALARLRATAFIGHVEITVNPEGPQVLVWSKRPSQELLSAFPQAQSPLDSVREQFIFDGAPIVNGAFSQASLLLNRMLVGLVREMAGQPSSVLDLYCGNGNFSLQLAAGRTLGLDHHGPSVEAPARMGRVEYRTAEEPEFMRALREPWDVVVLDPPRTGAKSIVPALAKAHCGAIIYVSCDPATLARDLRALVDAGWAVERAVAVDMFPNTWHVETVCRLTRP